MWREESYRLLSLLSAQLVMLKWIFSDYEKRKKLKEEKEKIINNNEKTFEDADTQGQERDYGSRCSMTAAAIKICMKLLVYLRDCIGLYLLKRNRQQTYLLSGIGIPTMIYLASSYS